jgi:hypothetical protein
MRVLIDIFQGIWIEEAKTETRLEKKMAGRTNIILLKEDGEPMAPKIVDRTFINQCGYFIQENIPISYKL